MRVRDLVRDDLDWLYALNQACVPEVNSLPPDDLWRIAEAAAYAAAVEANDGPLGGILAFAPGADYGSENYKWFETRYDDFLYVDRIMVSDAARGRGAGKALYQALFDFASGRWAQIGCEVNERPPNPLSMAFHRKSGFEIVGRQETGGGAKSVALMLKPL
ncbi:MAG: GNAT family N-acetyltransferase [Alphaproteobacteria bacterium]|nr:GNAT family N-acetyltransferase [Alphaproteobacteria bacterium]